MSKMSELSYDIEQLYIEGHSAKIIAKMLECPLEIVLSWISEQGCKPFDEWDADAQQRLINDIVADSPQEEIYSPYHGA